ncbi:universal stress protein [Caulobacter sp. 17J65-9]|uniref:universal stress protein n=1 Tax=Caulobacter sp. 17J65-9 TaxID=2709382 RepID=UPI0013C842CD|nr:universal stress protein [Caulobacter sp. 17J65-9]NEX93063.1 universal stress protein [Caulobacter sp. 17J65-9]
MEWGRVTVPLSGADQDRPALETAAAIATRFEAEVAAVYCPPDPAELTPWLGEGFVGGVQVAAIESLKEAAVEGERNARAAFETLAYPRKTFTVLVSPVGRGLSGEVRLSDLVVFDDGASRGKGPFSGAFEQVLIDERAAVFVNRGGDPFGTAVVAWEGGEPASRAARRAAPILRRCERVLIVGSPLSDRPCDLRSLQAYYAARRIEAEIRPLERGGDPIEGVLAVAEAENASLLVGGAFGHSRLREFIFGGATRAILQSAKPSLFLAH